MYEKAKLERFGTFRELTLVGDVASTDLFFGGVSDLTGHS